MLLCKRIHGNDRTGVIDFHGDSQCVMRVLLKVTWIQWPLWGEKVSLHEKLKEHLVPKLWWWTGQVCYKLNCTTHLSSATPSKVTWIQWPLWGEKVSLHVHEKLKEHLVLKLWWWTGQVCYKLNCTTHLSSATPSKVTWIQWPLWGEKVSLHEKLKEHLVLKLWWWTGQVCYKLNCTTDLSSATPSKVTWIQWPLWGEKVSLHEKLKEHLVLKLCGERGKCATNWIVQLTCQVPRPPRSRESNDPFEVKRCHCMKSLRNILSSSYGGERGKCATNWIVRLTCQVPRPPRSRESNDRFEVKRCHCMKSLRNILSSSYGGERGKCATNWIVRLTCQVPRPPRSRESNDPFEVKRCHCMKSLRNILSSSYGGERGKCATNWIVRLTCQVPRPPRSRESNDPFEVKRCHCMKSLRNILSSSYVVNGASVLTSSATPSKVTWIQWQKGVTEKA